MSSTMTAPATAVTFDPLRFAREGILAPAGLDVGRVEQALGLVLGSAVDSADLYFQLSREESWALEDGIVKEGSASIEQGVGVRAHGRREDRFCLFRRDHDAGAGRGGARGARHRRGRRRRRGAGLAAGGGPSAVSADRSAAQPEGRGEDRLARARRSRDAPHGSARGAGHGQRARGARADPGRLAATACWPAMCGRWCA